MPRHTNYYWCKDPYLWKENKASSRAEDDAKSLEVGTHEVGHWSDLSGGQSSVQVEKFWKPKCDTMLRWVLYYALLAVILCAFWCNAHVHVCNTRVQCMCAERCVRGWRIGSRIVGCILALLALLKGKWMKPKQQNFNIYSKVVCIIFQLSLLYTWTPKGV